MWRTRLVPESFRAQPPVVRSLALIAFFVALGFGIVAPALPLFARQFGVGRQAAAAVISIFAVMRLISVLGGGRLANRFGERRVLATGILIVAVSSFLTGLAQSYAQLLILRGAGGVGSAMFTVSASALLLRTVPGAKRAQANGVFIGGFLVGGISGPALGGLITGISPRAPFFIYALTLVAAATVGLRRLPQLEHADAAVAADVPTMSLREAWGNGAYRAAVFTQLADNWAIVGVRSALLPLFVVEVLHRRPYWTGLGFLLLALVNAAMLLPAGQWADTRGRKPVMFAGLTICASGFALLASWESLPGFLLSMLVLGFGSGLLDVAPSAIVGDLADGRRAGTPVAVNQMAGDLGSITGPLVAGRLADHVGYGSAFVMSAIVLGTASGFVAVMPETRRDGADSADAIADTPNAPEVTPGVP